MDHLRELLLLAEPLDVTQTLTRCLNVVFTLQGLRYDTASIIGQRLEAARRDWQHSSAAHQQLNFTLTLMQQENDRLRVLTVYFGTPSMFITLWFGFEYGTNPPLGTLII
jgi:hypothetical protein